MVKTTSESVSRRKEEEEIVRKTEQCLENSKSVEDKPREDEEKHRLLQVEDGPTQVQVISTHCQSTSSQRKEIYSFPQVSRCETEEERESVPVALLTLLLALFNLSWSIGLSYWHFKGDNLNVAVASSVIIVASGSITTIAFFTGKASPNVAARRGLWNCCKLAWLLAAVPCLVPVLLAGNFLLSTISSKGSGLSSSETTAPGKNEHGQCAKSNAKTLTSRKSSRVGCASFALIESLTLCFPMCILHLCVLLEDSNSIPSVSGLCTLFGLFLLSISITFSRFQFDSLNKRDRFGDGMEKYLRLFYLWSTKIIWLVTLAILIVTARLLCPDHQLKATATAIIGFTAIHEVPLAICFLPNCGWLADKMTPLFFLIPQFTSLISLIYWVNTDPQIYNTDIGSLVLGLYFWTEIVVLCGWLVDGSFDREFDPFPLYPHFFGDLVSAYFATEDSVLPSN